MFDANLRWLCKGTEFFTKVLSIGDCKLYKLGVRKDDILICEMLSEEHDNPTVLFKLLSGDVEITCLDEFYESWIVYEGLIDGTDFIDDKSRAIAMKMLEDRND